MIIGLIVSSASLTATLSGQAVPLAGPAAKATPIVISGNPMTFGVSVMSNLKIRKAEPHEAPHLSDLAFCAKAYWGYTQEFMAACRVELTSTADNIRRRPYFVAELDGAIIGFYTLEQRSPTEIELEALFVEPAYIGRGYGRALIDHAKAIAREQGALTMLIQSDPNAQTFYQAAGGQLSGTKESASIPGRYLPVLSINLKAVQTESQSEHQSDYQRSTTGCRTFKRDIT